MPMRERFSCLLLVVLCLAARLPAQQPAQPSDKPLLGLRRPVQKSSPARVLDFKPVAPCRALGADVYEQIRHLPQSEADNANAETYKRSKASFDAIYSTCVSAPLIAGKNDDSPEVAAMYFLHSLMMDSILNENLARATKTIDKLNELVDKSIEKSWNLGYAAGVLAGFSAFKDHNNPLTNSPNNSNNDVADELRLLRGQLQRAESDRRAAESRQREKDFEEQHKQKVFPAFSTGYPAVHCTSMTIGGTTSTVYTNCH